VESDVGEGLRKGKRKRSEGSSLTSNYLIISGCPATERTGYKGRGRERHSEDEKLKE